MKTNRSKRAIYSTVLIHTLVLALAILPIIGMVKVEEDAIESMQYIEIAFMNDKMSPSSASTAPTKKIEDVKKVKEEIKEKKVVEKEVKVNKNSEVSEVDDSDITVKKGKKEETTTEEIVESIETDGSEGALSDSESEEGEGSTGDAIDGVSLSNMEFDGDGVFGRQVTYHANISKMAKKAGRVVVNLCINRSGIVTHIAFNKNESTLQESEYVKEVMKVATKYRFEKDYSAPKSQCGKLSFIFKMD